MMSRRAGHCASKITRAQDKQDDKANAEVATPSMANSRKEGGEGEGQEESQHFADLGFTKVAR